MRFTLRTLWLFAAAVSVAGEAPPGGPSATVWDTCGTPAGGQIDLGKREAWRPVAPETSAGYAFKGDAVVENDRLQVVFSPGSAGPAVYSRSGAGKEPKRMTLIPLTAKREPCETLASLKITGTKDEATIEVASRSQGGDVARIAVSLGPARSFVKVGPVENVSALRVCARTRFAVLPDFFGDDLVFDPRKSPGDRLFVPAENFLLSFAGEGDTILMTVWPAGEQDVQALLGGEKEGRFFEAMEISFEKKSLYLAVLDAPRIWHSLVLDQVSRADQDIATGWKKPFEAKWRGDFRLADRTDSWEFQSERGMVSLHTYGRVVYPFWFQDGAGMVRLLRRDYLGTALVYPLDRKRETPLTVLTPVDMLRETLGAGPCEYILDREGIGTRNPGGDRQLVCTGVCNTTGSIQHFFERGLECKEGKLVSDLADDVSAFNIAVRQRLEEYRAFARKLAGLCKEEQKRNAAVQPVAERVGQLRKRMEELFAQRLPAMKSPQQALELVQQIKELTRQDDPENLGKYLDLASQLRGLANTQDALAGVFRSEVRRFRRELGAVTAGDRASARFIERLWELSRNVLRKKHSTEGA